MSGVGFWELIILFLIGLIVLGPERLPRVASQLGSWLGQARRMTRVMKRQLEDELNLEKDLRIRPPRLSSPPPPPAPASPRQEYDDTYSAAHDAGSVGTGVGDHADADGSRNLDESRAQSGKDAPATGSSPADLADEPGKPTQST
ncbi:MAG TPA: Sec-independent protein translocase protein TatB [Woeseiaceae bacterium]